MDIIRTPAFFASKMPRIKSKIVTSMPMSLREMPARIRRVSSVERAKEKALAVKARLFSRTKQSEGGRSLLLGKQKKATPLTSEVEEDEEEVEEVGFQTGSEGEYISEDSDWIEETSELQDARYARNPCPDSTKGNVALENFKPSDLPNRLQIEQLVSREVIQELEASIEDAWNIKREEISKEDEGSVEEILSTLPAKYLQIQLEESRRVIALAMRKLDAELKLSPPSEEVNTEQADIIKWIESAQSEEANL